MDVFYPRDGLGHVLRQMLYGPAVHGPREGHFALLDLYFNLAGINRRVLSQALTDVLADALVRTLIALRAPAGIRSTNTFPLRAAVNPLRLLALPGKYLAGS